MIAPSVGTAKANRGIDQRLQDCVEIEGRAADHLQNVGRRGLLLKRLGHFRRARLHLLEQPHILDGDHRLVGEGLQQLDLA